MKRILLLPILLASLTACNDEVFLRPLTVEPTDYTFEWTGGRGEFKANQDIDYVYSIIFRWVNGKGYPVNNGTMQYTLDGNTNLIKITNELCDITLAKDNGGKLTIESGYNLFPDTIYMNIDISSLYETESRGLRILPSPGFGHSEIRYDLHQCWYEERSDTIMLLHAGAGGGDPVNLTVRKKGSVLAWSTGQFAPYDKLLSDNIFGRTPFEVDEVTVNGYDWGLSGRRIAYSSNPQPIDGDSIIFNEDLVVTLMPHKNYRVKAVVNSEAHGFNYTITAISPIKGLQDRVIDGVYWLTQPTSYEILVEIY